jgi:hypothetical protein
MPLQDKAVLYCLTELLFTCEAAAGFFQSSRTQEISSTIKLRKAFIRDALSLVLDATAHRLTLPFGRVRQGPASADVASESLCA